MTTLSDINYYEIFSCAMFFQFSLYVSIRMAHHGFTLGELAVMCFGATALFLEAMGLTIARVRPGTFLTLPRMTRADPLLDIAHYHDIHQDLPSSHPATHLPNSSHPRFAPRGPTTFPTALPLTPHRPATRPPSTLPRTKAEAPQAARARLLWRCGANRRRSHRPLDPLAVGQSRPVDVGAVLASRRQDEVEPSGAAGVLGGAGKHQRCGVEQAARAVPPVSPPQCRQRRRRYRAEPPQHIRRGSPRDQRRPLE